MEQNDIEEYRTASHEITKDTLDIHAVDAVSGAPVSFNAIRPWDIEDDNDAYLTQVLFTDNYTQRIVTHEAILPKKLEVLKQHSMDVVSRQKGKIVVIGTVAITSAAGAGLLVSRFKK